MSGEHQKSAVRTSLCKTVPDWFLKERAIFLRLGPKAGLRHHAARNPTCKPRTGTQAAAVMETETAREAGEQQPEVA